MDEFSELFAPHQQGLPPPYPLPQLPAGPSLGGLGLGLAGRMAGRQACRWVDCCAAYEQQEELVRHIEKSHIDQRKGEDFTCFWAGCVRRYKPFNARYKLLIHMRVHSGEKPNKCMVSPRLPGPLSLPQSGTTHCITLGARQRVPTKSRAVGVASVYARHACFCHWNLGRTTSSLPGTLSPTMKP